MPALRLRLARNRAIADPRFRRWAARLPVLRAIARRRAAQLFDLTAGFAYTQALHAFIVSGTADALRAGPLDGEALAERTGLEPDALERLMTAAAGLDLVGRYGERWVLHDLGVAVASEEGVAAIVRHHALTYDDLSDPIAMLRRDGPRPSTAAFWEYAGGRAASGTTPEGAAAYSELMAATQGFVGRQLVAAFSFARHAHLVDLGGGSGAFAVRAAKAFPNLRVTVVDLPDVALLATRRFEAEGLADRCAAVGGSFEHDAPGDGDVYTLVRVLYDHDDEAALAILRAAREALPQGTPLLVAEPMAGLPGAERVGTYFTMYLAAMRSGRCRSIEQHRDLLARAGFASSKALPVAEPVFTGLVRAIA